MAAIPPVVLTVTLAELPALTLVGLSEQVGGKGIDD